jgi:hypothetical protein
MTGAAFATTGGWLTPRQAFAGSARARNPYQGQCGILAPAVLGTVGGRCVLERRAVHVVDLQAEREAFPEGSAIARELGHRTALAVPLLREGTPFSFRRKLEYPKSGVT